MTSLPRLRSRFALAAALLLGLLFAGRADAGAIRVRDDAHLLTNDDLGRLRSALAGAPFDGRVALTSDYADVEALSRYAGSLVTEPNMVAVAVDTQRHHVEVHFGTGSHVPRAEWGPIEHAGNDAFRRAEWAGGAIAIFRAAERAVAPAGGTAAPPPAAPEAHTSLFGPGLLFLLLVGGIAMAYMAWRRSTSGGGYVVPPNYGPGGGPYTGQGYPPPYPGTPQGGMGPLGGGLIGAGLGGLAGYELGKLEGERERAERGGSFERAGTVDEGESGGDFDAGGGGSSWDDDGGGGGFDGGGGGDSSGGGSDF